MKKILFCALICLILFLTAGCGMKEGTLKLQIIEQGVEMQTLLPDIDMTIASYDIVGTGPLGASFTLTGQTGTTCTVSKLAFGEWTIRVYAKNPLGVVIGEGQSVVTVHVGETTPVNVVVTPLTGTGTLNVSVNWTAGDTENPAIASELIPPFGAAQVLDFTLGTGTAAYSNSALPTGYYSLTVQLLDNGLLTMGAVEVVRIVKGGVTDGSFDFFNLNQPGGEIIVGITPVMDDPLEVTLSGQVAQITTTGSMAVTASVPAEVGNVIYVWYINGVSKATGPTYTVSGLEPGTYRLDVTAFTVDGKRAGSESHTFTVSDTPVSPYWIKTYSGLTGMEMHGSIDLAYDGGYVMAGATDSFIAGGNAVPAIWKIDPDGNLVWAKQWEVSNGGVFYAIATATDGGYFAAGNYNESTMRDAFLIKVDSSGHTEWEKTISGPDSDVLQSVVPTSDGGCIVAGFSYIGGTPLTLILHKFDATGEPVQGVMIQDSDAAILPYEIRQTSDGGFCVVGGEIDESGNHLGAIIKLSASLNIEWTKILQLPGSELVYRSFVETPGGDFIVAGTTGSSGTEDVVLTCVSLYGQLLWTKQYGGADPEMATQINRTAENLYVVSGFNPSSFSYKGNTYILGVDEAGNVQWERIIGDNGDDPCLDMKITPDGALVGVGSTTSYNAAYSDFWVFKANDTAMIPSSPHSWAILNPAPRDIMLTDTLAGLFSPGSFGLATVSAAFAESAIGLVVQDVTF